jgi:hypothetical protein
MERRPWLYGVAIDSLHHATGGSVRYIIRVPGRVGVLKQDELASAMVHRMLAEAGISARPVRRSAIAISEEVDRSRSW